MDGDEFDHSVRLLTQQQLILEASPNVFELTHKTRIGIQKIEDIKNTKGKTVFSEVPNELQRDLEKLRNKVSKLEAALRTVHAEKEELKIEVEELRTEAEALKVEKEDLIEANKKVQGKLNKIAERNSIKEKRAEFDKKTESVDSGTESYSLEVTPMTEYDEDGNEFTSYAYSEETIKAFNHFWREKEEERKDQEEIDKILKEAQD